MSLLEFINTFIEDDNIRVSVIDCSMSYPVFNRRSVRKLLDQGYIGGISLDQIPVAFIEPGGDAISIWVELY